jgi:hypothetical protein
MPYAPVKMALECESRAKRHGSFSKEGVKNINAVNDAIKSATPWYAKLGAPVPA